MSGKKIFITYGDEKFTKAKENIIYQAKGVGEFDEILSYGPSDISEKVKSSPLFQEPRGGGLYTWKPDVILTTINRASDGDIIVYADSACTLQKSREWKLFWEILRKKDIIAQRIFQRNDHWSRKEVIDGFKENGPFWSKNYQFGATIILRITPFTRKFIKEWRDVMIENPMMVKDVTEDERRLQHKGFRNNRHDQTLYSALIYKYLNKPEFKDKIYTQWEHFEYLDPFCRQAIRATRLRMGEKETNRIKIHSIIYRIVKDWCIKPFWFNPRRLWYSFRNNIWQK